METGNNNRLSVLLGQQGVESRDFTVVSLISLAGVLLILLLVQSRDAITSAWSMSVLLLTVLLFFVSLATHSRFREKAETHLIGVNAISLVLMLITGLFWGSLYGLIADVDTQLAGTGFWVTLLVTLSVAAVFRHQIIMQLLWIATIYLPLIATIALENWQTGNEYLQVILVMLAVIFFPAFFPSRQRIVKEDFQDNEKLQKEYDDLRVAFAAQDAAIEAETALRQAVEESLRQANQVAEAANRSKTEFMATVGHEIRTPLNGILPILEMLAATHLDKDQKQLVDTASHSSRHLLRIINDVLDFSKVEVGKLEIESIELNLHELVHSITDLMKQAAESKGLALKVLIAPEVPKYLRGDSLRLKQIITNLLSNALKFTEKGEISLQVTLRHEHVREVELMFTVRDTGIGMSEQTTGKLFRSFTQADASTTRTHGGTGLGLAICKRLVELMGGEIGVQSVLGRGSTFWFVLPMRKSLKIVPPLRDHLQDARILYYSRELKKNEDLKTMQQECRVQIETSHELQDAVDRLSKASRPGEVNFYDLVVIDVFGHEVSTISDLMSFRKYLQHSMTQVLVVNAMPNQVQEFKTAGADAVLVRPFRTEVFRQRIYRLLDIGLGQVLESGPNEGVVLQDKLSNEQFNGKNLLDSQNRPADNASYSGKVLLVEDNPVNLAVARRMLQLQGLTVEEARDGIQALEVMKKNHYDIVFMDCLMPNMDGFETTRQWRIYESQHALEHLSIIAMTANAMRGDREKCIAAKMDDYLPKPLTAAQLEQILSKWLPDNSPSEQIPAESREVIGMTEIPEALSLNELLDASVLSELQQVMGDDFESIIFSYLQHASQLLTQMKHKAEEDDRQAVLHSAHSFKSSSKNVGAIKLGELARMLEESLKKDETVDMQAAVQELVIAYAEVAKALQEYV